VAPLTVGDKVTLVYQQVSADRPAAQDDCIVMNFHGSYVRCETGRNSRGSVEDWVNLAFVAKIAQRLK